MLSSKKLFYLGLITVLIQITITSGHGGEGEQPTEGTKKKECSGCGHAHHKTEQQVNTDKKEAASVRAPSPPKVTTVDTQANSGSTKKKECSGCGHAHHKTEQQVNTVQKEATTVRAPSPPKVTDAAGRSRSPGRGRSPGKRSSQSPSKRAETLVRSSSRGGSKSPNRRSKSPNKRSQSPGSVTVPSNSPSRSAALQKTTSEVPVQTS